LTAVELKVNNVKNFSPRRKYRVNVWYLTPLSTIFQLYCGGQFYWWRKPEYQQQSKTKFSIVIFIRTHFQEK
jgi:hypothetical protein